MHALRARLASLVVLSCALAACATAPGGRKIVDRVDLVGLETIDARALAAKLATAGSPRFLGLFRGFVLDYELLDPYVLARDLERVERYCRARGHYDARVRAARIVETSPGHVAVTIEVEPGEPMLVGAAALDGVADLPFDASKAAFLAMRERLTVGARFDEDDFAGAEKAIVRALEDEGYAFAKIQASAGADVVRHVATVRYAVTPGPRVRFGPVLRPIAGLGELPEDAVVRALHLPEGKVYSRTAVEDAERAVLDLDVFASVEVTPDLEGAAASGVAPVRVRVARAPLRTLRLGGGTELDVLRTDVHLETGWEDRNFLGGLRKLTLSVKPGLVLYPTKLPTLDPPKHVLPEQKSRVELRQRGFVEARTDGILRGEFNIYPVLLQSTPDPTAPILGYREVRGGAGVDRRLGRHVYASLFYNVQTNFPFTYVGDLDASFRSVVVSYVDLVTSLDYRDDAVSPHKGVYVSNDAQIAGGVLRGDTRDVRVQPEARGYVPISRQVTLAVRATMGFLFPSNYGGTISDVLPDGRDVQLVYFRAFFSGGPSSNRGYPFRGIGPHGAVPFFNPGIAAQQLAARCDPQSPDYDSVRCAVPLGGLSLWETSAEVRFPIMGPVTGATFCDASDVSTERVTLRADRPHLSCGLGLRYKTPIGPLRVDGGWRVPGFQVLPNAPERNEGDPGTIFGAPMAVSIGLGESF